MVDEPKAPEIPEDVRLNETVKAEKKARAQRVMAHIEAYCKENRCLFIAMPRLEQTPSGGWVITAAPGVNAL